MLEIVREQFSKSLAVRITTDSRPSISNDGYIAITAHYVNNEKSKL